jgi:ABC-2 type transport system ATP-binding protein
MDIEKSTLIGLYGNKIKSFLMLLAGMESFEGDIVLDSISLKGDIEEYLNLIALMTKESIINTKLSVNDFLDFYGCLSNAFNSDYEDRKDRLLEEFELLNLKNTSIKKLSEGNRKKVKLLSLFLKDRTLILIDTFLEGFSKVERKKVIAFLKKYAKEERIVLVGSEDLQLLQSFSDEIYILN